MAGALPIVSQVAPYKPWLAHDTPALMAANRVEFERQVKWCFSHRDEVKARAAACRDKVLAERTIQGNVGQWQEALETVMACA